jgi:hypothetical protein
MRSVRTVFFIYLAMIVAGLGYSIALGILGH